MVSALHQASYLREKELVALDSGKRTTVGSGGFFVYRQQITRRKKGSQEDPLIFFSLNCNPISSGEKDSIIALSYMEPPFNHIMGII